VSSPTVSRQKPGRHRSPSTLSAASSSFSSAVSRSVKPASKASAVIVISGAMVASLALPASATPTTIVASTPVAVGVAVSAPSVAQAPLVPQTFGTIGFTGIVKPKPKPKPKPVVKPRPVVRVAPRVATVSRSTARAPIARASAPRKAVAAPAPRSGGVLGTAASLSGIYYIYGGTTPAGFDCSGYTQYVFKKAGINLPRTAEQQRQGVTKVSTPRAGDLVFFGAPAYHVGIYAGNGKLWDSPKTGSKVSLRAIWTKSGVTYGRP
jgi:peptidoglycan DL-endopeptidase CwlO